MKRTFCKLSFVGVLVGLCLIVSSCTHPLVVRNIWSYREFGTSSFENPIRIGIIADGSSFEELTLLNSTASSLAGYSAKVFFPYSSDDQLPVDVIAYIAIRPYHEGSGWNFLINFPGWVVFAPAWHGYIYNVKYLVECKLVRNGTTIDQFEIPIALDVRHAALNRTWTVGADWLFTWGVCSLVGGILYVSYDESITPMLVEQIESPLGKYIASQIVKKLNSKGITFIPHHPKNSSPCRA